MNKIVITVMGNGYEVREYTSNSSVDNINCISVHESQTSLFNWLKTNMDKPKDHRESCLKMYRGGPVYCGDCVYYADRKDVAYYYCLHPNNLGNWYRREERRDHCSEINHANNCKWFKAKEKG